MFNVALNYLICCRANCKFEWRIAYLIISLIILFVILHYLFVISHYFILFVILF